MPVVGNVRGFNWTSGNSIKVKIENDLMILDGVPFGSKRHAEVLFEAMIGKDVIVLRENSLDYRHYLNVGEITDEQIKVTNGTVFRLFDRNFAEIYSDEKAHHGITLVFIQVEAYPCRIQTKINEETLVIEEDDFRYSQAEEHFLFPNDDE